MTDPSKPPKQRDVWDKLDIIFKGLVAIAVSGALTFYGIISQQSRADREREDRSAQMLIQLVNARESANTQLRSNMFNTLLQHYFRQNDFRSQIVVLELIGLNFRDAIQIKPMFEQLDRDFADVTVAEDHRYRSMLRKAARNVVRDQLDQIRLSADGHVCEAVLKTGEIIRPGCFPMLAVKLVSVDEAGVRVQINSNQGQLLFDDDLENGDSFSVGYYDMPMVDYTSIAVTSESMRYSIVLLDADPDRGTAEIAVAVLPVDTFSSRDTYLFDELLARYLNDQSI